MTGAELEALLSRLDLDRERAGERYEEIRRRLMRLFEWRGCLAPEDLADETINRVARRLAEGIEVRSGDPYGYFCGVAHLVYKEVLRRAAREPRELDPALEPIAPEPEADPNDDARMDCLRRCLAGIPEDQSRLLLRYHGGDHNIRTRKTLATELDIPLNALRIRVHRVRRKVEACAQACLQSVLSGQVKRFRPRKHSE